MTPNDNQPKTAQQAVDNFAQGLGQMVWWDLYRTAITPDDLRGVLKAEGDDPSIVPDIDPDKAVRRAAFGWKQGRGKADRYKAEVVYADDERIEVGILKHERVDAHTVEWKQVDVCTWMRSHQYWQETAVTDQGKAFRAHAIDLQTHLDHQFIRPNILQARMKAFGSFPLRRQGGIYFVAAEHSEEVSRLSRIIRRLGDSSMTVVTVSNDAQSQQAIGEEASNHLSTAVDEISDKIESWTERANGVTSAAMMQMLEELDDLRAQARLYGKALSIKVDDLQNQMDAASNIVSLILDKRSDKPTPQEAVAHLDSVEVSDEDAAALAKSAKLADLQARYQAATGTVAPPVSMNFRKVALARAVLAAERLAEQAVKADEGVAAK